MKKPTVFKLLLIRKAPAVAIIQQHRINKWRTMHTPHTGQIHIVTTDKHVTQLPPKTPNVHSSFFSVRVKAYPDVKHNFYTKNPPKRTAEWDAAH